MNIKEALKSYNSLEVNISIAEEEIEELQSQIYNLQSTKLDGMPKPQGYSKSQLEELICNVQEQISQKQKYINKLKNKIKVIQDLVKTLKKYNQDIISMRYFQNMSIKDIAEAKNKEYRSIQKTIFISIKQMQKKYQKTKSS